MTEDLADRCMREYREFLADKSANPGINNSGNIWKLWRAAYTAGRGSAGASTEAIARQGQRA